MNRCWPALLVTIALLAACSSPTETSYSRAANATYTGVLEEPIMLENGTWQGAPYADGGSSRPVVRLLDEPVVSGDLDSDGADELVVLLAANFGGSGTYIYIALVDSLDNESFSTGTAPIGDRIVVTSIDISGDVIKATTIEHAEDDPMCCPSLNRTREWTVGDGSLTEASVDATMRALRGHVTIGHEVRAFVECDSAREGWIADMTQGDLTDVYERLAGEPYQPVFVELNGTWGSPPATGFGADFEEAVAVDKLIRAEREGFGCLDDPSAYTFRATGNEPAWRADVHGAEVSLSRMTGDAIDTTVEETRAHDDGLTISTNAFVMRLFEDRCVDSMSGSVYAWSVNLDIGTDALTGCAVAGHVPLAEIEGQSNGQAQ